MIVHSPLQRRWLRHHFDKWTAAYGWSAAEFAHRVKQPHDALAEALGLPVEDFAGPVGFVRSPPALDFPGGSERPSWLLRLPLQSIDSHVRHRHDPIHFTAMLRQGRRQRTKEIPCLRR